MMRLARTAIIACTIVVGAPLVTTMQGCSLFQQDASPNQIFDELQADYIFVVRNLIAARSAGRISGEQWRDVFLPLIERGDAALDQMDAARQSGDLDSFGAARIILAQTVAELGARYAD